MEPSLEEVDDGRIGRVHLAVMEARGGGEAPSLARFASRMGEQPPRVQQVRGSDACGLGRIHGLIRSL